ncbi:hypothetical protein DL769_008701 [Monosporascus sp. CRB-8-3]|nr:hypothetical protein DL769_008701 [Monosporascus sp. CRB-8-3]
MASVDSSLPPSRCQVCESKENLLRCGGCQVVKYCGRDCQAADRSLHKRECNAIKKNQEKLVREIERLRSVQGNGWTPDNLFEECVGRFWGIFETRDYMRQRYALVEAILKVHTVDAVEAALSHLMDMVKLNRGDSMGLRSQIPALMLRLNKDQECYDFVKWWHTCDPHGTYDWGNLDLPHLDVKDADAFEPCDVFLSDFPDLGQTAAVMLLKVRLLIDLQSLQDASKLLGASMPQELIGMVQERAVGPLVRKRPDLMNGTDVTPHIKDMEAQVLKLFNCVKKANEYFWPALVDPDPEYDLNARPEYYSPGTEEEMQVMLQHSYASWVETPGAIDIIETLLTRGDTSGEWPKGAFDLTYFLLEESIRLTTPQRAHEPEESSSADGPPAKKRAAIKKNAPVSSLSANDTIVGSCAKPGNGPAKYELVRMYIPVSAPPIVTTCSPRYAFDNSNVSVYWMDMDLEFFRSFFCGVATVGVSITPAEYAEGTPIVVAEPTNTAAGEVFGVSKVKGGNRYATVHLARMAVVFYLKAPEGAGLAYCLMSVVKTGCCLASSGCIMYGPNNTGTSLTPQCVPPWLAGVPQHRS